MPAAVHLFTTWLCLLVGLTIGVTPAQGFVLCFEPSGEFSVESSVDGKCPGCESPDEHGLSDVVTQGSTCGCVDVPFVQSTTDFRVKPSSSEFHFASVAFGVPETALSTPRFERVMVRVVPRTRAISSLAFIRSTVLLV